MSAPVLAAARLAELVDARRLAHRMLLGKPPGRIILASWCLEISAELRRRGDPRPECPFCRADVDEFLAPPLLVPRASGTLAEVAT